MAQLALPYCPDSTELFERIRHLPYPALLDSGGYGGSFGRYDILCAQPTHLLQAADGNTQLMQVSPKGELQQRSTAGNPFDALQQLLLEQGFDGEATGELPFCGGALGFFGYDLGRYVEQIPTQACADIQLPDLQIGLYPWAIVVDHQQQSCQLVSHQLTTDELTQLSKSLTKQLKKALSPFRLSQAFDSNLSAKDYRQRFEQIQHYIHSGDCYQVNLAQRFSSTYQGDCWQAYQTLRQTTGTPFSAYLEFPEGAILSLSPERFLQVNDGQVETRPIKGTRPRHHDPLIDRQYKQQLIDSPKDRAENLMIVDLLRNDLGRSCKTGSVRVPELFKIESYANVHHLVTAITAELEQPIDVIELFRGSFPGGSITGAPKIRSMEIIEELEPHRRSAYCGSIGYIGLNGQADSSICIRTLVADRDSTQTDSGKLHCWAGGGIVADSDCEAEYQETFDKVNNLLKGLQERYLPTA
ncbi:aminodeoxychorismate synthase component I [Motiliproteus coralliicola]|uniref:aminodeoxychorismate synthase n=1 Tax=Motiliproteus coralliicola TaxID=2283196 RepID=A0A369X0N7_9GAMM|nr:aminodeoxychorismate synthase component I [Motiliproteus coralliicola]